MYNVQQRYYDKWQSHESGSSLLMSLVPKNNGGEGAH